MKNKSLNDVVESIGETLPNEHKWIVAYSGGWDSSVLLSLLARYADDVSKIHCVTFKTEFIPWHVSNFIPLDLPHKLGIQHSIIKINLLKLPDVANNTRNRCYSCKSHLFHKLYEFAEDNFSENFSIFDGTNFDDTLTYRPGLKALKELGIISPLAENKLTKKQIIKFGKVLNLENCKQSTGSCLATRFPYNTTLDTEQLVKVAKAEKFLKSLEFYPCRVRTHSDIARIEIAASKLAQLLSNRTKVTEKLKSLGFKFVTIDLDGFRSGSMDE